MNYSFLRFAVCNFLDFMSDKMLNKGDLVSVRFCVSQSHGLVCLSACMLVSLCDWLFV